MKNIKYLMFSFLFLFIGLNGVKASPNIPTSLTYNSTKFKELIYTNFDVMNEEEKEYFYQIYNDFISSYGNDYDYIITITYSSKTVLNGFNLYYWKKNTTFGIPIGLSFDPYVANGEYQSSAIKLNLRSNDNYIYTKAYQFSTKKLIQSNYSKNTYISFSGYYRILESTVDIYKSDYKQTSSTYDPIPQIEICNDELCYQYYSGDLLFDKTGIPVWENSFTFEDLIDTTYISKIEFKFKVPQNQSFSFDLDLLTQFSDYYLSKPYLVMKSTFDEENIIQIDDFLGDIKEVGASDESVVELYEYSGEFGLDFNPQKELKLVFDTSNYVDDLYIKFTSSLNYEVNYINKIDEIEYYETIMMNDKYGLYLIPKVLNTDNFTNIFISGNYDIQIRNNFVNSNEYDIVKTYKNYTKPNFQYKFNVNNYNYLVYFQNIDYSTENDDGYYITFDTRYFNYAIKDNPFSDVDIENPNTGDNIHIDFDDDLSDFEVIDNDSFFKLVSKSFNKFTKPIGTIFSLLTDFFNGLPNIIKYMYVVIFFLLLAYFLFKFIL